MQQNINKIVTLMLLIVTVGCSKKIDYMVVASSTEDNSEVYITDIKFDDQWGSIGGIKSCCWGWAGGLNGIFDVSPPKSVYVQWYDFEQKIYYGGSTELSENLYEYATSLPPEYWGEDKRMSHKNYPYLIVSVAEAGEVFLWISNAARDTQYGIRVMHEVGRMQAEVLPIPPRNAEK